MYAGKRPFVVIGLILAVGAVPVGIAIATSGLGAVGTTLARGTGAPEDQVLLRFKGSFLQVPREDGSADLRLTGTKGFVFAPGDAGPGDDAVARI